MRVSERFFRGFQRSSQSPSQRQISSQRLSVLLPLIVLPLELSPTDPLQNPPTRPPKLASADLSVVLCTPFHSHTRRGGLLGILKGFLGRGNGGVAIYENPGFPASDLGFRNLRAADCIWYCKNPQARRHKEKYSPFPTIEAQRPTPKIPKYQKTRRVYTNFFEKFA